MRHRRAGWKLGRNTSHRRALLRNLVTSLIVDERIETTLTKAKAMRPHVEKMITLGKRGDVAARRQAAAAGRDPAREIQVLLLHGLLHCLGHDHEVDGGEMERLERRLRRRWIGAPAPRPRLRQATSVATGDHRSRDRPSPVAALVAGRRMVDRAR